MAFMLAGTANAQCTPEPNVANGTTTCTGTDADGVVVTAFGTRVNVESGATVNGAGGPAVSVRVASNAGFGAPITMSVSGRVDGGAGDGVNHLAQPIPNSFSDQQLNLTILAGGTVTGTNGIVLARSDGVFTGLGARIDNSGTIAGMNGFALLSRATSAGSFTGFSSIINRAGGTIGAISGAVGAFDNAGTIDGGTRSAIEWTGSFFFGPIVNSGTITSANATATIANTPTRAFTNSGQIVNTGGGAAVAGTGLTITNETNGRIAAGGTVAIRANDWFKLTNAGTIDGNVVAGSMFSSTGSILDSTAGRINGSVTFGRNRDLLVATHDGTQLLTGIVGAIDGGGGLDTVLVRFVRDTTLSTVLTLPSGFEEADLAPAAGTTLILADGFSSPNLLLSGRGTIINRTALSRSSEAVVDGRDFSGVTFINEGIIQTTGGPASRFAVTFISGTTFENRSTVSAPFQGGVSMNSGERRFTNSGIVTARETGVSLRGAFLTNNGTIRSTAGVGLILEGVLVSAANSSNAGLIEGATVGARLSGALVNTGTISSPNTGVQFSGPGRIDNMAGGVITGGTLAIGPQPRDFGVFGMQVVNAGTINGNVSLPGQAGCCGVENSFEALPGGVLNGNLVLGARGTLITELANTGPGAFAGITGTVTATDAALRYRVRSDASAVLGTAPAGFTTVGYELFDDAALTLTANAVVTSPLILSGEGRVDVTADIATGGMLTMQLLAPPFVPGQDPAEAPTLDVVSRGTLTLVRNSGADAFTGIVVGGPNAFENAGTITATNRVAPNPGSSLPAAIGSSDFSNWGRATNSGTITLDGATGIRNLATIVNSGTIAQAAGGRAGVGIEAGFTSAITNSGTIDVAGTAILANGGMVTIDNSGRIASSGGTAIVRSMATITNQASGVIAGGAGFAIQVEGGSVTNAGTITGTVDLGAGSFGRGFARGTYRAAGGTVTGDVLFGRSDDLFVRTGTETGVSGTIDGGDGFDLFGISRSSSATVTLDRGTAINFEADYVEALGADTVVTLAAAGLTNDLYVNGDGAIVSDLDIDGALRSRSLAWPVPAERLAAFTNRGTIRGGVGANLGRLVNEGTIDSTSPFSPTIDLSAFDQASLTFDNRGTVLEGRSDRAVQIRGRNVERVEVVNGGTIGGALNVDHEFGTRANVPATDGEQFYRTASLAVTNSGVINGRLDANLRMAPGFNLPEDTPSLDGSLTIINSGTITANWGAAAVAAITTFNDDVGTARVAIDNSGTIRALGAGGTGLVLSGNAGVDVGFTVTNSGTIAANAGGETYRTWDGREALDIAVGLGISTGRGSGTVTNTATGIIEATGTASVAVSTFNTALDLTNAGTIRGTSGTTLATDDYLAVELGRPFLAGAVQTIGDTADRIVNTGTIIGSVDLGAGDDRIENYGRIEGDVFLGDGDDVFLHRASAILTGTVDAGFGTDSLIVDATGGGAVNGDRFVNFERFSQVGEGNVTYSGNFRFDTIGLAGGTLTVAAGETLRSEGAFVVTGGDGSETVVNNGTVAGSVELAGGDDRFVNNGLVEGAVLLGAGNDRFTEGAGSRVAGIVDGGSGDDIYAVLLAGDRGGIGQRVNFERLAVEGSGTLTLALDQDFASVTLAGTGLDLALNGQRVGSVTGTDAAERLMVDGDVAMVMLGGGDDRLALGTAQAAGRYDGGTGTDELRFTANAPVMLTGSATGFEQVRVDGGALTVAGTLGSANAPLAFGAGDLRLTVAPGGTLAGLVDLGAGDDALRLAAGSTLSGTVTGGAGTDSATVELAGDRTLGAVLRDFELLTTEGRGTLTLTGVQAYNRVNAATDLAIATDGVLTAPRLVFGAGDNRLTIAGRFAGSVDGGAGTDRVALSGGTAAAPVAFADVTGIEGLTMTGGHATVSGTAGFGTVDMSNGRLVGLAGSTMAASRFTVGRGATFGSAGTVNGTVEVAGILSPGASPGTMTVNGNVSLLAGSRSVFELTPTVSDRLLVNGAVSIASGATLELVPTGTLRPGTTYDLIVASGGISGGFGTVVKPDSLFGFVIQRADRIQLLGRFLAAPGATPQVSRSIAYANDAIAAQGPNSALFAALPSLVTASGASNTQAFALLTPEAYATATQMGVDNALTLVDTARSPAFATGRSGPGLFTFGQGLAGWHRLGEDAGEGVSSARSQGYGFMGGIGYGDTDWAVGAFGGTLDSRQQIAGLGVRTDVDGYVAGLHSRLAVAGFNVTASIAYNDANASTRRALPAAASAGGRYDLRSWVGDLSVGYALDMGADWSLTPHAGLSYVRTTRSGLTEQGSPFALTVAGDRHRAGFVDGGIAFGRSARSDADFRPFVSLGLRHQIEGRVADAVAGYAGAPLGLEALGASRARTVGTVTAGLFHSVNEALHLFTTASAQTGNGDHRETVTTGLRLDF